MDLLNMPSYMPFVIFIVIISLLSLFTLNEDLEVEEKQTYYRTKWAHEVFKIVVRSKTIQLQDILKTIERSSSEEINREEIESALETLKNLELVKSREGVIPLLTTYYITARGLKFRRKVLN